MKHGSLFSGIGGFDLAAQWMGWENIFHCEKNEFGKKILKYYWPEAISYDDIKTTDFSIHRGNIDILTGGFPCQPYSTAGKRKGKEDERHLWPEMLRAIREIKPAWVVGENVLGLTNWNGGVVFNEVQVDLENEGYEVQPYILPACGKDAPHRRERVWFIAHATSDRRIREGTEFENENGKTKQGEIGKLERGFKGLRLSGIATDPNSERLSERISGGIGSVYNQAEPHKGSKLTRTFTTEYWEEFPTQSPICGGDDGLPGELDGITFSKWRKESIMAYGNAIVPQVAYEIFNVINLLKI